MSENQIDKAMKWFYKGGNGRVYYKYLGANEYLYMFRDRDAELMFWMFVVLSEEGNHQ